MNIHESAMVSKKATIGKGVSIGPWCVIEDDVVIGDNTRLWQNVYVAGGTRIGKGNVIHMGAVLGHEPQHLSYKGEKTGLIIGDGNIIREGVSIHRSFKEGEHTIVGNKNFFMGLAHIAHDCKIGNEVIICNNTLMGGHVGVEDRVFIGGAAGIHQFSRIGTMAMIGGLTRVDQDVVPYTLVKGDSEVYGLNLVGLRRSDLSAEVKKQIKQAYKILYQSGLNTTNALAKIKAIQGLKKEASHMIDFIASSKRGICKHSR